MRGLRYIFLCVILLTAATTCVYSQSWDMFFDKGKEHYDKGNYEKAIRNFELYLKYESDNPKAEVKVDVPNQTVTNISTGNFEHFDINAYKKYCLMNAFDDIDFLLDNKEKIEEWESNRG